MILLSQPLKGTQCMFMKRAIRFLPTLFLLPLLGLIPNGQRIEKAEAISTSYRYFIVDGNNKNGFENNATNVGYNSLSAPYRFVESDGKYKIQSTTDTTKYLYMNPLASETITFSAEGSQPSGYVNEFTIGEYNNKHYIKVYGKSFYLYPRTNNWKSYDSNHTSDSTCLLNIFSVEEDAAPFVTAMNNIACTDLVNGPKKTDENSWESASTAFNDLQQPTKNYLKTLASDKTEGTIDTVEKALAKYDYIVNKYNKLTTQYTEFIDGRDTSGLVVSTGVKSFNSVVSNTPIIIATVLVATLSLISVLLVKKKNK